MAEPDESDGHVAEQSRGDSSRFRRLARLIRSGTGSVTGAVIVIGVVAAWLVLGALTSYPRWWELLVRPITGSSPDLITEIPHP
jgi:hypothetical protein